MRSMSNSNPFQLQVFALVSFCQLLFPVAVTADNIQANEYLEGNRLYTGALIPDVFPKYKRNGNSVLFLDTVAVPTTGTTFNAMSEHDVNFVKLMRKWQIPGAQLAIMKDGKLIYSKAYGWSNIAAQKPVGVNSLFRIASVSKALTAVCLLKMVDQQQLKLDTKVMDILKFPDFKRGDRNYDERLDEITVKNLLQCTGGWDRSSGDPMFAPMVRTAADEFSKTLRPDVDSALRYALRTPTTYEPGSHYSYSNVGYGLLGLVTAKVAKAPYQSVVREQLLKPLGITNMQLGKTLKAATNEVTYYPFPGQELNRSLFPNFRGMVPLCYGGDFALEAMQSDCGWLASAQDLCTFTAAVFADGKIPPLLSPKMKALIQERPDVPEWKSKGVYFGMGWEVAPNKDPSKVIVFRHGSLPGCMAVVVRRGDGVVWSFVFNTRPKDWFACQTEFTASIWKAIDKGTKAEK